jgi:NAD(P)-dependent dehydrogenase (short-subunit alcohol dehydrogenase family)
MLINQGHQVILHARNAEREMQALEKVPGAEKVLTGDLSSIEETKMLAEEVNAIGHYGYSDSKLHVLILAMAVARKWENVYSNAVTPGWVPTKMGGRNAPDDLEEGAETQVWLAVSNDKEAKVSGRYFYHMHEKYFLPQAADPVVQEKFHDLCEDISGVGFPSD